MKSKRVERMRNVDLLELLARTTKKFTVTTPTGTRSREWRVEAEGRSWTGSLGSALRECAVDLSKHDVVPYYGDRDVEVRLSVVGMQLVRPRWALDNGFCGANVVDAETGAMGPGVEEVSEDPEGFRIELEDGTTVVLTDEDFLAAEVE